MIDAIQSRLRDVDTVADPVKLVLLGDIFELLKSDVWLDLDVRPWHDSGAKVTAAAHKVLNDIASHPSNAEFFDGLQALRKKYGVQLAYLPGNHDALLADKSVVGLRELLRTRIEGLPGTGDAPFDQFLIDAEHGVVAEHGHELDAFNRAANKSGRFVPGDAVVIEMLVGLPRAVKEIRKVDNEFSAEFSFLHEMDNVEPQNLAGLLRWLEFRLQDEGPEFRRAWESSVAQGLRQCVRKLQQAMSANGSLWLARKVLYAFTMHRLLTKVSVLRKISRVSGSEANEFAQVARRVGVIAPGVQNWEHPPDIFIAGHTHAPLQRVFSTAKGQQMTYLNSGTWRRVQSPVQKFGNLAFREAYHEALVCVHRRALVEQNGRYELRRYVRGK